MNTVAITNQGENFVTGGEDKIVKVWGYNDGREQNYGQGHSGGIVKVWMYVFRLRYLLIRSS